MTKFYSGKIGGRIGLLTVELLLRVSSITVVVTCAALSAFPMDFQFKVSNYAVKNVSVIMTGEIKMGDFEKFRLFMVKNLQEYSSTPHRGVYLSSDGGDLVEALKIAAVLKRMYPSVDIAYGGRCASACFFLYLSGAHRQSTRDNTLGIHRAYFDPVYFAGLSLTKAEQKQKELTNLVNSVLEDNSVPRSLIEIMNRTSSLEIHWLTKNEREQIEGRPAWYEELLIAKCNYDKALEKRYNATSSNSPNFARISEAYMDNLYEWATCEGKMIDIELKELRPFLMKK